MSDPTWSGESSLAELQRDRGRPAAALPSPWLGLLRFSIEQSRKLPNLHQSDREDAAQEALVGYYRACERGVHVASPEAYIKAALSRQAGKRARERWQRRALFLADMGSAVGASLPPTAPTLEWTIEALRAAAQPDQLVWLEDTLGPKTDRQLAAHHGVTEAAIRKRRHRLELWVRRFFEEAGHNPQPWGTCLQDVESEDVPTGDA